MSCADALYAVGSLGYGFLVFQLLQTRSGGVETVIDESIALRSFIRVMVNFGPELMSFVGK
jgi:hypothetical protein